jgi:hypothetical protein
VTLLWHLCGTFVTAGIITFLAVFNIVLLNDFKNSLPFKLNNTQDANTKAAVR